MTQPHERWLQKADHDLAAAQIVIEAADPPFDMVCFHSQQAVEKCLKGFLTYRQIDFRKEHDLEYLLDLCINIDPAFRGVEGVAEDMNGYGVAARYPTDFEEEYTQADAAHALRKACEVSAFVRSRIG